MHSSSSSSNSSNSNNVLNSKKHLGNSVIFLSVVTPYRLAEMHRCFKESTDLLAHAKIDAVDLSETSEVFKYTTRRHVTKAKDL